MKTERRYLCAYFPEWSIQIAKRCVKSNGLDSPRSVLLTRSVANHLVISRRCATAAQAGVQEDMALPLALALSPGAHVAPFDPIRDCRALYRLAVRCLKLSPLVGLDRELFVGRSQGALEDVSQLHYGLTIDLTGTARLHGDIQEFALRVYSFFKKTAAIAVAPTLGAAWALSRYSASGPPRLVLSAHDIMGALSPLPVTALRIPNASVKLLQNVGIMRIGDLVHLPRHTLAQRFGKFITYRLEQAHGEIEERLTTVHETKRYRACRIFEPPLTYRKGITTSIHTLFKNILHQLRSNKRSAKYFYLLLHDTTGSSICREFSLASATDDIAHLSSIIEPIINEMTFSGEICEITLTARQIEAARSEQSALSPYFYDPSADSCHMAELLNTFSVRIGKERLLLAKLNQSHIPERSFSYESAPAVMANSNVHETTPHYTVQERPSYLLPEPEEVTAISMLPDKPPAYIQWRGEKLKVIAGFGPERIAPEWWATELSKEDRTTRDYFKVQDECGRWLWIYRDYTTQLWFLHGMWL